MTDPRDAVVEAARARANAFETALRIRIWNQCKARNMNDDAAILVVRREIASIETALADLERKEG